MTKILLADDHDLVRDTLKLFLEAGGMGPITVAGSVSEAEAALADPGTGPFDIVILDYDMPGMNGLEGLRRILQVAAPVVLLSGSAAAAVARDAIGAGARGFLPKTMPATALTAAIQLILGGETFFPFSLDSGPAEERISLTAREQEVLQLLAEGLSNKEIARELGVQEVTVKLHVRTLSRKLGARNRTHAVMIARDHKLVG